MGKILVRKAVLKLEGMTKEIGLVSCRLVEVSKVKIAQWVSLKCRYGCKYYGQKLTCPPYSPKPEDTKKFIDEYQWGVLLKGKASWQLRYAVGEMEKEAFLLGFYKAFGMGAGPCMLCDSCDVSKPCKNPQSARPAMEACGIDVFGTVRCMGESINWSNNGAESMDVFGLLLLI